MEYVSQLSSLVGVSPLWILFAIIWSLGWKGVALWKSARLHQKYWFITILFINTLGILEIIYLLFVARKYKVEVVEKIG